MPGIRGAIGNGRSCLRSPGNFGGDGTRAWLNRASGLGRWFGASLPTTPCPKHARSFGIPTLCRRTLAKRPAPAQPERPDDMGIGGQAGGTLAPQAPDIPSLAVSTLPRQTPEVGAVCGNSARTVLCGGRSAMSVPTAIVHRALPCSWFPIDWHVDCLSARLWFSSFPIKPPTSL